MRIELDLYTGPNNDVAQVFIDDGAPLIPMLGGDVHVLRTGRQPGHGQQGEGRAVGADEVEVRWRTPATTWEDYYR